jgi:hypothetical protein
MTDDGWYWLDRSKETHGSYTVEQVVRQYMQGVVEDKTFFWKDGAVKSWTKLQSIPVLTDAIRTAVFFFSRQFSMFHRSYVVSAWFLQDLERKIPTVGAIHTSRFVFFFTVFCSRKAHVLAFEMQQTSSSNRTSVLSAQEVAFLFPFFWCLPFNYMFFLVSF